MPPTTTATTTTTITITITTTTHTITTFHEVDSSSRATDGGVTVAALTSGYRR